MFSQQTFIHPFGFGELRTYVRMSVIHVGITCQGASAKFSVHLKITINARESACQVSGSLTVCHTHSMFMTCIIRKYIQFAELLVLLVHSQYRVLWIGIFSPVKYFTCEIFMYSNFVIRLSNENWYRSQN